MALSRLALAWIAVTAWLLVWEVLVSRLGTPRGNGRLRRARVFLVEALLLTLDRENVNHLIEINPRAAAAFFEGLVQVFIERLRTSGELVAEITRWGLEATGLDMESR